MTDILTQVAQIEARRKELGAVSVNTPYTETECDELLGMSSDLFRIIKGLLDGLEREKLAKLLCPLVKPWMDIEHVPHACNCKEKDTPYGRGTPLCKSVMAGIADAIRQSLNLTSAEGDGK
jgi:hypothetical protein